MGFLFSLKNKVTKPAPGRKQPNAFGVEKEKNTKVAIDGFDGTQGATQGSAPVDSAPLLVIKPATINKSIVSGRKTRAPAAKEPEDVSLEARARASLITDQVVELGPTIDIGEGSNSPVAAPSSEDYEAVPVDDFGAALLRGMGWAGTVDPAPKVGRQKTGLVLGIGAKGVEQDLETELLSTRNLSAPLLRRERPGEETQLGK